LFRNRSLAGGMMQMMGLGDASGQPIVWCVYDADAHRIGLSSTDLPESWIALPKAIAWVCIELSVDALTGVADLAVNGISRQQLALAGGDIAASCWIGGLSPDAGLTGELDFAYWAV